MRKRFAWIMIIGFPFLAAPGPGGPALPPQPIAGEIAGMAESRWIAPYVHTTTRRVAEEWITSVSWFTPEGRIARELTGSSLNIQPGFVSEVTPQLLNVIHATNGDWQFTLPQQNIGTNSFVTGTDDSRIFIHQFDREFGLISADIYVSGNRIKTIGPFIHHTFGDVHLAPDGSIALLIWKTQAKNITQVVSFGPDGNERFRADCDGEMLEPSPAPGGNAVLVQYNGSGEAGPTFAFYTETGKGSSSKIGPNARIVAWLPGTTMAVMQTSIGHTPRWRLIDWQTAKPLWDVSDPNLAFVEYGGRITAVFKQYLLINQLEYKSWGNQKSPTRSIYALDIASGKVVAHWLSGGYASLETGKFVEADGKLFLLTSDAFSQIKSEDISEHKNGWK